MSEPIPDVPMPTLAPHRQAAVDAEQAALEAHMAQVQQQAQVAYLAQRLHALAVENADLRQQLAENG